MSSSPNVVTSADGTRIAYDRAGDGPPVVLLGGAFQHRAVDPRTAQLAQLLATDHTVLHYDRRGRGDSGDTAPNAPEREIEDLAAMIEAAGGTASVFAMSSGGALALDATVAGVPIGRLAVYEPPLIVDGSRPPLPADYLRQLTELPAGEAVEYFLTTAAMVPRAYVAQMRDTPVCALADVVRSARAEVLPGQTHDVAPEVLAPVLLDFFRS